MTLKLSELVKDKSKINLADIRSGWTWLISNQKEVLLVTVFGDLFLVGPKEEVNWLNTGTGELTRVADSVQHFEELLKEYDNFANWFLPDVYTELVKRNVRLKEQQVYGYKKMPLLSGDYSVDNFEPTDISVHFALTGQICEQTQGVPDGTKINVVTTQRKPWWKIW